MNGIGALLRREVISLSTMGGYKKKMATRKPGRGFFPRLDLPAPHSWTSHPPELRSTACWLSHPANSILLEQPQMTKTDSVTVAILFFI